MRELAFRIIGTSVKSAVCTFSLDQPTGYLREHAPQPERNDRAVAASRSRERLTDMLKLKK